MAFYGRRYRRYRRYKRFYRTFRRRGYRRRRFINASSKSRIRVKIPVTVNTQMTVPADATLSNVISISPLYGNTTQGTGAGGASAKGTLLGDIFQSPLYAAYAGLYDQVKLDGFKLNFSITSGIGPGGTFPSLSVYTAVDRKLNQADFAESLTTAANPQAPHYPVASELRNSSSYLASVALNNSVTKMIRRCYASDLFEKASFADASNHTAAMRVNGVAAQNVRCLSGSDPAFVPCMFFACDTGSNKDAVNDRDCTVVIEIMYYLTFRNPKYGGAAPSSRTVGLPRGPIFPDVYAGYEDDDGDMDEGDGDMDPPPVDEEDDPVPGTRQKRSAAQTSSGRVAAAPTMDTQPPPPRGAGDSGRHPHRPVDQSQRLN